MARIRSIKPTFWTDEKIGLLPRAVRYTFLGLISAMADDQGRLVSNSRIIRGAIYPYDDDVSADEVADHIEALIEAGRVVRYRVNGDDYLYIRNWLRHQRVDKPSKSLLPEPPTVADHSQNGRGSFGEHSTIIPAGAERSGAEGIGEEWRRSGAEGEALAALPKLPPSAEALLARFYELPYNPDRYHNVRRQLVDTVALGVPGPKIRGGIRVKARDEAHLEQCCRAVLDDPPNDRDMAIVLVLKKLTDRPKGPSLSEQAAKREADEIAEQERYHHALKARAVAWANDNPERYNELSAQASAMFPDVGTSAFAKSARDADLTQRCGREAGFPSFEEWRRNGQEFSTNDKVTEPGSAGNSSIAAR